MKLNAKGCVLCTKTNQITSWTLTHISNPMKPIRRQMIFQGRHPSVALNTWGSRGCSDEKRSILFFWDMFCGNSILEQRGDEFFPIGHRRRLNDNFASYRPIRLTPTRTVTVILIQVIFIFPSLYCQSVGRSWIFWYSFPNLGQLLCNGLTMNP